jgi:hypothetical protein
LGLYLGDGCIAAHPRGFFRLRIVCADAYPELIQRCEDEIAEVLPNKVSRTPKLGCIEVAAYSKHWPCLLPQHGPGRKHGRNIELTPEPVGGQVGERGVSGRVRGAETVRSGHRLEPESVTRIRVDGHRLDLSD